MAARKPRKKIAKAPKAKVEKKNRKETRERPGLGHNIAALAKEGEAFVTRYLKLSESMESDMAGYRSDFKELYEEAANSLGFKQAVVKKEMKRIQTAIKAEAAEAEMAADDRQQTELWRSAMEKSKYAKYSQGDLFPAVEPASEDDIEAANDTDFAEAEPEED